MPKRKKFFEKTLHCGCQLRADAVDKNINNQYILRIRGFTKICLSCMEYEYDMEYWNNIKEINSDKHTNENWNEILKTY